MDEQAQVGWHDTPEMSGGVPTTVDLAEQMHFDVLAGILVVVVGMH